MRDTSVSEREIWVQLDGLLKHLQRVIVIFAARVISSAKEKVIRLRMISWLPRDGFFFLRRQRNSQSLRDAARNLFLDREHVFQLPVVTLGPYRVPRGCLHQLRGNAYAAARAPNRTLQHVGRAQLLAHLLRRKRLVAKREHFRSRENLQLRDLRNLRHHIFGDAVAKIFVFFCAALVLEIQHRHGFAFLVNWPRH